VSTAPPRLRRAPPAFRPVVVRQREALSPHLVRLTLHGDALAGLDPGLPTASVRLLVPHPGQRELVLPTWRGNEFLDASGERPVIRTYTLRRFDPDALELDVDVVLHERGVVAAWAAAAAPGDPAAISGTGRGYAVDPAAPRFLLAGDEAAVPAISVLLEVLPPGAAVDVHVEVARPDARVALPEHPGAQVTWHDQAPGAPPGDAVVRAVAAAPIGEADRIWVAGEAAAVQRVRRHLFDERGVPRSRTWVRGYWKEGRAGGDDDEA